MTEENVAALVDNLRRLHASVAEPPTIDEVVDLSTIGLVGTAQGYDLRGYLYDERDDTYVVVLFRPYHGLDPYVVGRVKRLQDREWSHGNYHSNYRAATRTMARRAGVDVT
jgi:hypothetical protein